MNNYLNSIFLLTTALSQIHDVPKLVDFFVRGIDNIFPNSEFTIELIHSDSVVNSFEICTRSHSYGFLVQNKANVEVDNSIFLLQNLSQMVAVFIENANHDTLLKNQKALLENLVEEKTRHYVEKAKEFEDFFSNALDLLCIAGIDGVFIKLNKEWENSLGYTLEELEGRKFLDFVHPEDVSSTLDAISNLQNKESILYFTNRYRCKNGSYKWIEWKSFPSGNLIYAAARDISNRILIEKELKEKELRMREQNEEFYSLNEELRESNNKIQEINKELLIAKERAEESNRLKSAFLANMSHEIRTPMNGIIGFAEMLGSENLNDDKRKYYTQIIVNSSERILALVNDILDLSKIETGQLELHLSSVNLNQTLKDIYTFFLHSAQEKGLDMYIHHGLNDQECTLQLDEGKLKQILTNLISNAIKFTNTGQISFGYEMKQQVIKFWVEDTGIGIPLQMQNAVFERFRQGENFMTTKYKGSGLGLSICKGLVEFMGGAISLSSKEAHGSTFSFTVPHSNQIVLQNTNSNKKIKILVAEDEEINFLYIEEIINDPAFEVIHAHNGQEAVEYCTSHKDISLIFMDLKMPVMNGYQATKAIRNLLLQTPIIAYTAFALTEELDRIKKAEFNDFLIKPVKREHLMAILKKYVDLDTDEFTKNS